MSESKKPNSKNSAEEIQKAIYSNMSYAEKWEEAKRLREVAVQLKTAGLKHLHPDWTDEQIKEEVRKIFLYATT